MSWIVGKALKPREKSVIRDNLGIVYVDHDFIKSHPTWYSYQGHVSVNGDVVHCYMLNT